MIQKLLELGKNVTVLCTLISDGAWPHDYFSGSSLTYVVSTFALHIQFCPRGLN